VCNDLSIKYQTDSLAHVELLYVMEQMMEPGILADDVTMVRRTVDNMLLSKHETENRRWHYALYESYDHVHEKFERINGIPFIGDTFKYTPECWIALITATAIKDIVQNERFKTSAASTKNLMMSQEFRVRNRAKTNVFYSGVYLPPLTKTIEHTIKHLGNLDEIKIEYSELLNTLGYPCSIDY
jgi:hypothetical protein